MALFPRSFITNDQSAFPPIFRLLDEFDQYSRSVDRPNQHSSLKTFTPKFDIKELRDSYQLHGELPGIDQKDVEIEFTDASTLTIKGRSERSYTNESADEKSGGKAEGNADGKDKKDKKETENTFWVMERSVGEFSRSFGFPVPVDQDAVKASMKNGILSVIVPKAKKQENKKITIQ
ncbi:heat shock protein [Erysiphe necator]|nr:heat shock protein [Erysiphe necator]